MEVKKSPKADLENKKTTNLLVGAIMILAVLFVGFEWSERDKQVTTDSGLVDVVFEEEIIPITEQEQPKQAPPPPEAPKVEEVLEIMDNDSKCCSKRGYSWFKPSCSHRMGSRRN